ncbi:hypothetical protein K439DRAFT_919807 [Ramaria rubella]|nr:hypothetical protein K439DRAFT_919807 [Ramaria rubella]
MSVVLDESHTHSTTPQRKRSRQEQSCDAGSGPGSSDGSSGSGSSLSAGSMDDEDNEDNNRQVGSQKRARSEDHGNTDGPRGSVSWSRGNPPPLSSVHIRQSAGGTPTEGSPVDSLIPLPVVPPREARRDTEETIHIQPSSAHEDLARSMEFDQHMDVLRHSPAAGQQGSSNVDTAYDILQPVYLALRLQQSILLMKLPPFPALVYGYSVFQNTVRAGRRRSLHLPKILILTCMYSTHPL